jgi:hypothetical protein
VGHAAHHLLWPGPGPLAARPAAGREQEATRLSEPVAEAGVATAGAWASMWAQELLALQAPAAMAV